MQVKLCGLSSQEEVIASTNLNADFCGFILNYPKSHRYISYEQARKLTSLPKKNSKYVGVLVKPTDKELEKYSKLNLDYFQIYGDYTNDDIYKKVKQFFGCKIDVVLSDMATNTSGNKSLDSFRTGELCMNAMDLSFKILNKEGVFLSKIFMGSIFDEINKKAKNYFKKVIKYKPISSKKESKEIYIYCKGIIKI